MPVWLDYHWWRYVFAKHEGILNIWCRMRGHPNGVVWYRSYGLEPDMCCKDCGEDLG